MTFDVMARDVERFSFISLIAREPSLTLVFIALKPSVAVSRVDEILLVARDCSSAAARVATISLTSVMIDRADVFY